MTLEGLLQKLTLHGATSIHVKALSPNDNSKNQIYCGGDLSSVSWLPTGSAEPSKSASGKRSKSIVKFLLSARLAWISSDGRIQRAPHTKVIFYPQYPEVRLSGFLKGAGVEDSLGQLLDPRKRGREPGRVLMLAPLPDSRVLAHLCDSRSELARQLLSLQGGRRTGTFSHHHIEQVDQSPRIETDPKSRMLSAMCRIANAGWIDAKRLDKTGHAIAYNAPNAGGYTLEAELGISPNGAAEPDYLGWEVKQYGVTSFVSKAKRAITLMTPEPNGGQYAEQGVAEFMKEHGYPDSKHSDRLNFSTIHSSEQYNRRTGLILALPGVDAETGKIMDASAGITLQDRQGKAAAIWHYSDLMDHWKRKHGKAVFVRSVCDKSFGRRYQYSNLVELGEATSISLLLRAIRAGYVYYDPGLKMEKSSSSSPVVKRRNQFRVHSIRLHQLYEVFTSVNACDEEDSGR